MPVMHVIGLGMDPADIPLRAARRIMAADVLAGGARHLEHFPDAPGRRVVIKAPLAVCLEEMRSAHAAGERVVIVCGGDALHFGLGRRLIQAFGAESLTFHPAPTAPQTAASLLGLPFANIPSVSLHGRADFSPLYAALMRHRRVFVYTDAVNTPSAVAQALLARGAGAALLHVFENMGEANEKIIALSPAEAAEASFGPLNIVLADLAEPPVATLGPGLPDELYLHEAGLITKWPVRAAAIAALRLSPDSTLWDLGAGCGAVGIEASALVTNGRVVAVEKHPGRAAQAAANAARLHAFIVETVCGEMPGVLAGLPDPDRIFVGGGVSGARGEQVLAEASRRLAPGGRIVVAAVLLSTLETARRLLCQAGFAVSVDMIQAATGSPLAGDVQLKAHNPVYLIRADKPGPG
jgi:precorrin-6B C5,15-methyltransferase / cobalt-precorrin-6B C5,C15-methyltransferase